MSLYFRIRVFWYVCSNPIFRQVKGSLDTALAPLMLLLSWRWNREER